MCPRLRVVAFLFHEVVDSPTDSGFQVASALPYKHDAAYFLRNLDVIERCGKIPPVSVFDVDFTAAGRYLLLTFDDGGKSAMRTADYLEARGWRGHFFITTNMIGSRYFVGKEDIRDLRRRGHVVGSHSHTHPRIFYNLPYEEMVGEWETSCRVLSDILQEPIVTASIPGGDMNRQTVAAAAQAGIRYLFTSEPTPVPWNWHGVTCLGRVCPKQNTSLKTVEDFARFRGFNRQWLVRKCKQTVKAVGMPLYRCWSNRPIHRETDL